jgi:hypothetical protein
MNMGMTTGGTKKRGRPKKQEEQPHEVTPEPFFRSKKKDFKMRLCGDPQHWKDFQQGIEERYAVCLVWALLDFLRAMQGLGRKSPIPAPLPTERTCKGEDMFY